MSPWDPFVRALLFTMLPVPKNPIGSFVAKALRVGSWEESDYDNRWNGSLDTLELSRDQMDHVEARWPQKDGEQRRATNLILSSKHLSSISPPATKICKSSIIFIPSIFPGYSISLVSAKLAKISPSVSGLFNIWDPAVRNFVVISCWKVTEL